MTPSSIVRTTSVALAALVLSTAAVLAGIGDPIVYVPIGLEHDPGGIVAHGATNDKGEFTFANVKPGKYLIVIDAKGLSAALKRLDPKGLPHTIGVTFGLAGEKPIVTSSLPETFPIAANLVVHVAVGDVDGDGDASKTKPHTYVGIVSLLK